MRRCALLLALLLASPCWGQVAIYHDDDASQTLYARIYTSDSAAVAVALTAGTSGNTRRYKVTDAAVTSAGISADGSYPFTIFSGTPSTSASDTARGSGVLVWIDGASARDLAAGDSVVLSNSTLDSMWTRWMQTATADGGASTYGRALHYLRGAFSAANQFSTNSLANAPSGDAEVSRDAADMIAARVNAHRGEFYPNAKQVWVLQRTDSGLAVKGGLPRTKGADETLKLWIDFAGVMGRNEYVETINSLTVDGGTATIVDDSDGVLGNLVYFSVTGGADGDEVTVSFDVTTTEDQDIAADVCELNVVE